MHKRLVKGGSNGEGFKEEGKKEYKYAPYF